MVKSATLDPSRLLYLYFRKNRAGNIKFIFRDADGDPVDIESMDFELFITNNPGSRGRLVHLTIGDGLTFGGADDNELTATFTADDTNLNEGTCFWELYRSDIQKTWLNGKAIFHCGEFDGVSETNSITISDEGSTVIINLIDTGWGFISGDINTQTDLINLFVGVANEKYLVSEIITNHVLTDFDGRKILFYSGSSNITVTIGGLENGFNCIFLRLGTGIITFVGDGTPNITTSSGTLLDAGRNQINNIYALTFPEVFIDNSPGESLINDTYSTVLTFDRDKTLYQDVGSVTFTLAATGNVNGVGIILKLNTPTSVSFPASFEAHPNSASLDNTKLNVYTLVYFSDWDGAGTAKIIYTNSLFTAI